MKIRYCTAKPDGAISWYRVAAPLLKLKKLDPNIDIQYTPELNWDILADTDILYIQNPYEHGQYLAACMAKDMNIKLWVDFDDDVLNIPVTHPDYRYFSNFGIKETIWKSLEMADVVTVTTPALRDSFLEYNKNTFVIENAFNDYNQVLPDHSNVSETILWRGGHTHWDDLVTVLQEIKQISIKRPEWIWNFVGRENDVRHIIRFIPNSFFTGELTLLQSFHIMKNSAPSIFVHPLVDNQFNRAKSNIAWIEATMAGAIAIVPEFPEYYKPGSVTYKDGKEFLFFMETYMKDEQARETLFQESKKYIIDNLLLSNVNKKRIDIIDFLFSYKIKKPNLKVVQ